MHVLTPLTIGILFGSKRQTQHELEPINCSYICMKYVDMPVGINCDAPLEWGTRETKGIDMVP